MTKPWGGRRGKGFRPDTKHQAVGLLRDVLGDYINALATPPDSAQHLEPLIGHALGGVQDQGQTGSCVGFTFSDTIGLRCAYLGNPIPLRSGQGIYTLARCEARKDPSNGMTIATELTDGGTEPGLAVAALVAYGAPAATVWPYNADAINAEPSWMQLEGASASLLSESGYVDLSGHTGASRSLVVKTMLAQGIPVPLACQVDESFETYVGAGVLSAPKGDLLGGHMISLIGYETNRYRLLNHWSSGWGDEGLAWVDESWLQAATNVYALNVVGKAAA